MFLVQLADTTPQAVFAGIDKCQLYDNKIYILDFDGSRSVKVFDFLTGHYLFTPGNLGNGPGEFTRIYDFDVNRLGIFLLDRNSEKILHFSHQGRFINEHSFARSPYKVNGLAVTNNGDFLIGLDKGEVKKGNKVILTDTTFRIVRSFAQFDPYDTEGELKLDMIKRCGERLVFHYPVSDDLFVFDTAGNLLDRMKIKLSERAIPDPLRADFEKLEENSEPYTYFYDTPFVTDRFILSVLSHRSTESLFYWNRPTATYALIPFHKHKKYKPDFFIHPVYANDSLIISFLNQFLYNKTTDFPLSGQQKTYLEEGGNLLVVYRLKQ